MFCKSVSDTDATNSSSPAKLTMELEVADNVADDVVGVTIAPSSVNFCVMVPSNGATMRISFI